MELVIQVIAVVLFVLFFGFLLVAVWKIEGMSDEELLEMGICPSWRHR